MTEPPPAAWTPQSQFLSFLRAELDRPDLRYAEPPRLLGGGFSNEIVAIRLLDAPAALSGPLVVRVTHDDAEAVRESVIQQEVAEAGFRAPPVVFRASSSSPLGRPFAISPFVSGTTFDALLRPRSAVAAFRRMPGQLAETMSALHAVPTQPVVERLAAAGWPASRLDSLAVLSEVESYTTALDTARLTTATRWLRAQLPGFGPAVVCHGDLHPLNLLFEWDRVTAVFDWELARVADPAFDVARTLLLVGMAPYPMSRVSRVVVNQIAARLGNSFVKTYRTHRFLDEQSLRWHEALHCLRTVAMATIGAEEPPQARLRRLADVWLPVAPRLKRRFHALTSITL